MRTLPASATAAIAKNARANHVRVYMWDGVATFRNLADLEGFNWIRSVAFNFKVDSGAGDCRIELIKQQGELSLSTLRSDSTLNNLTGGYVPLIELNRPFYVETAITAPGVTPQSGDWFEVFRGRTDQIDWGAKGRVSVQGRDQTGQIIDTFIETERSYSLAGTDSIQAVMQDILDDNGLSAITLSTPVSPGFTMNRLDELRRQSVWEALMSMANLIGWRLGFDWGGSSFDLRFTEPPRTKVVADATIAANQYYDVSRLGLKLADIRNAVEVGYRSENTNLRQLVSVTDGASITKYGRRFMSIVEDDQSQINTSGEATTLANAALDDLSLPSAEQSISMPYRPDIELNDLLEFSPNGVHYDTAQKLAVVSISHALADKCRTTVEVRGKPTGGFRRWLRLAFERGAFLVNPGAVKNRDQDVAANDAAGIIPNSAFEQFSSDPTANPPDNWIVNTAGAWADASLDWYFELTTVRSGGKSVKVQVPAAGGATNTIKTKLFPIEPEQIYTVYPFYRNAATTNIVLRVITETFDSSGSLVDTLTQDYAAGGAVWVEGAKRYIKTGATAVNARVSIIAVNNTGSEAITLYVDRIVMRVAPVKLIRAEGLGNTINSAGAGTWTSYTKIGPSGSLLSNGIDNIGGLSVSRYTVDREGEYDILYGHFSTDVSSMSGRNGQSALYINGTIADVGPQYYVANPQVGDDFDFRALTRKALSKGDYLEVYFRHDSGVNYGTNSTTPVLDVTQYNSSVN